MTVTRRAIDVAVVLTGGHSQRMGQDKALVRYLGVAQLERTVNLALGCAPRVLVSCRDEQRTHLEPELGQASARVGWALDAPRVRTPFEALGDILGACAHQNVLVLGVDMPLLEAEAVAQLTDLNETESDVRCFSSPPDSAEGASTRREFEPFPSLWRVSESLLGSYQQATAQGHFGFRRFLAEVLTVAVAAREPRWLTNVNTPEEAQAAEAFLCSHSSKNASICSRLS